MGEGGRDQKEKGEKDRAIVGFCDFLCSVSSNTACFKKDSFYVQFLTSATCVCFWVFSVSPIVIVLR